MTISSEKVVALSYELSISATDVPQRVIESVDKANPFYFLVGHSGLPEAFEQQLAGKAAGDNFTFTIDMMDAYGPIEQDAIMDLPNAIFTDQNGKFDSENVSIGKYLYLEDDNGQQHRGKVIGLKSETVTMDFNHPLSGFDLHFSGTVESVREAEEAELAHGHAHGPDGHHHH
jgi:FKBP-type peptidyl-prolyl cis-trans isomerase SlyD